MYSSNTFRIPSQRTIRKERERERERENERERERESPWTQALATSRSAQAPCIKRAAQDDVCCRCGRKNLACVAEAAKKSATRKDPPAVVAELPTSLPALTLADAARYLTCVSLFLSLACRRCHRQASRYRRWRSLRWATTLSSFSLSSILSLVLLAFSCIEEFCL
jgi:hypothetical protein